MSNYVPNSWLECSLGEAVDYASHKTASPEEFNSVDWLVELEDIEKDSSRIIQRVTVSEREPKSNKNRFERGDILYGKLRPYLNKVVIADADGLCTTEIIPIKSGLLDKRFLFYFLKSKPFLNYVSSVSHGMRMPRLGTKQAKAAPFVIAPKNEQARIADKLDQLLAQVETIKARVDAIPAILKRFRQSVLATAVSGKLTEEWRKSNNQKEWREVLLKDICNSISDGDHQAPPKKDSGIPFFVISNISKGFLDFDGVGRWVSEEYFDSLGTVRIPSENDILYTVTGSYGIPVVVDSKRRFCFQRHIGIIKPNHEAVNFKYLNRVLQSSSCYQQASAVATGTAQKTVPLKGLRNFKIPFPSLEEQNQIVQRVEQLFAFADQIEQRVTEAQVRIDKLTQSILAKAFRGELVPQDPNDEPASELLERIKAEREAAAALAKAAKKAIRKKKPVKA